MAAVSVPGNSSNPPFPPHLNPLFRAVETESDSRDTKLLSAYANLGIARYFMHHGEILTVSSPVALHHSIGVPPLILRLLPCTYSSRRRWL